MTDSRQRTALAGGQRRNARGPVRKGLAGQALVLFVVLVGVLALGLILLFNTGQAVDKKVRLTHAADAAAYSVAVQQARTLNFAAYMNRGKIANDVAVAQLVSLWSWSNMLHTHTIMGYNLFTALSAVPVIGSVAAVLARVYNIAERVIGHARTGIHVAMDPLVKIIDGLNTLLDTASGLMLDLGTLHTAVDIAKTVAQGNDPDARLPMLAEGVLRAQLVETSRHNSRTAGRLMDSFSRRGDTRTAGMDRLRNVVMASRDHFSADRSDSMGIPLIDLEGRGGTDMVDYGRWVAMDTLDLSIDIAWVIDIDVPLGWGGAQAVKRNESQKFFNGIQSGGKPEPRRRNGWYSDYHPGNRTYAQYGGVSQRSASGSMASTYPSVDTPFPLRPTGQRNENKHAYFTGYSGLRDYEDIRLDRTAHGARARTPEGANAGPVFSVYLESDRRHARTSEDIDRLGGRNDGPLDLRSQMEGDRMTAISSAQVYFNRAPDNELFERWVPRNWKGDMRKDTQLEAGSLFSPYWQARLIETPNDVYVAVGAARLVGL